MSESTRSESIRPEAAAAAPTAWAHSPEVDARVDGLLAQMTLEEKVAFVTGDWNFNYGFFSAGLDRLGIPNVQMADGPAGVRINRGDVNGGRATALPAPIALAATWDPELGRRYGTVIGVECRATDHNVSLGPAVDIARVPIAGRTFESYGEDPVLVAQIGVGVVRGIQEQGVQACAKHFAINNQEHERNSASSDIDERTMMEVYLRPFEALVGEAGVASMMASFNRVNGTFACESRELLLDILRRRFGFRGWVMSDYGANHSTADAANAGLDNEQPGEGFWGGKLLEAVRNREVAEGTIDGKVRNMLRPLVGLGQIEDPVGIAEFDEEGHDDVARRIAEEAMVLLANDGILPLRGLRSLALIGPDVDAATATGGGSSTVRPTRTTDPLGGLTSVLGDGVAIEVAYGTDPITPGALLKGPDPIPSGFFATPDGEVGLHAEYWTNTDLGGDPFHVRTDAQIDLNLGFYNFPGFNACSARYEPLPGELNGQMSARWTGTLTPPVSGVYEFSLSALGEVRMSLDGVTVVDSNVGEGDGEIEGSAALAEPTGSDGQAEERPVLPTVGGYGYGHHIDDGTAGVAADHVRTLELVGGRAYRIVVEYRANHPSQGFLTGAQIRLGWGAPAGVVAPSVREAAALAARSDVAVVIVRTYETEADDRPHLHLPNGQDALVREVMRANPRTVVVLMTGAPVAVNAWDGEPAALLQAWYPGQTQGDALARVLAGVVEPGGRLPLTLPLDLSQTPAADPARYPGIDGRVAYGEGVLVGYRGIDAAGLDPAYPFGHGLGYTAFEFSDLAVEPAVGGAVATVSCTVRNVGDRTGAEVVQAYVGRLPADVVTAPRQLAAFRKVRLDAGAAARVTLEIPVRAVSYFDAEAHDWATPRGEVDLVVGASSRDERLIGTITVA